MEGRIHTLPEEGFSVAVPAGWKAERDPEDGGLDLWNPGGPGDLHLAGFANPAPEPSDAAEELYAFLEEQEIELEEDEIEDLELGHGGELALCEYVAEDEEGTASYTLLAVASLPGWLVFAQYSCEPGEEEMERATVVELLRSIHLAEPAPE